MFAKILMCSCYAEKFHEEGHEYVKKTLSFSLQVQRRPHHLHFNLRKTPVRCG